MAQALTVRPADDCSALFTMPPSVVRPVVGAPNTLHFLTRCLSYFRGIGRQRIEILRRAGVTDWAQLADGLSLLPRHLRASLRHELDVAFEALHCSNTGHFISRLPRTEHWRIAAAFPQRTTFLDIETTGLSRYYHQLTLVGWAIDGRFDVLINDNISSALERLVSGLEETAVLVTFNGAHFDVPFLRAHLPNLVIPAAHVDLRHLSRRAGATGGQKRIEAEFGIRREDKLRDMTSADAPVLWFKYQRGDIDALNLLIQYNHADVEGLRLLLATLAARSEPDLPIDWKPSSLELEGESKSQSLRSRISIQPYAGDVGPRLKLRDLPCADRIAVVGIDLSGSARSITGWALINSDQASTRALRTDDEIISATVAARPHLVSIDAPLSLPHGRKYVGDDDPGRKQYGITRECERILRRRGVNVYPCLIQSMQALTGRGIRIANELRIRGIPVIESFPGAMQDILGMPRKRVGLSLLKQAIIEYGIRGPFITDLVTHDELDALCSAIVGQMFWDGYYEPLGNDEEEFLIVPDVNRIAATPKAVIGISGHTGSGKTTVAKILERRGYEQVSFSGVLSELFPNPGGASVDRATLQRIGEQVHEDPGQRWLDKNVLAKIMQRRFAVIDGLRFPEDHSFFVERLGQRFIHINVSAPPDLRRKRFIKRGDGKEAYEAAMRSPTEAHISLLRELAHSRVGNSGDIGDIEDSIDSKLSRVLQREMIPCL